MKLNRERTGCGLSVDSPVKPEKLKEKMNKAAESITNIFVPSDVGWEGEKYYFYISHRQSLKEYIYENGLKLRDFYIIVNTVSDLFKKSEQNDIDGHEFVFDYECIFVGSSLLELEFIYAPDRMVYRDGIVVNNKCSDMLAIISLHIDYTVKEISRNMVSTISNVIENIAEWENRKPFKQKDYPYDMLSSYICTQNSFYSNVKEYIMYKILKYKKIVLDFFQKKEGKEMKLYGKMLLDGMNYSEESENVTSVNIGRDEQWADVSLKLIYISRRHATVYRVENDWYIKDLNSKNGTFVDGIKITSEKPFGLKNGCEICLGLPETKFIFCLP